MYRKNNYKSQVSKRQFYRRVAYRVKQYLNEFNLAQNNKTKNENVLNGQTTYSQTDDHGGSHIENVLNGQTYSETSDNEIQHVENNLNDSSSSQNYEYNPVSSINDNANNSCSVGHHETSNSSNIQEILSQWASEFKISHVALTGLLKALSPIHPELPKDSRTLLNTPHKIPVKSLDSGEYCHFGLKKMLSNILPLHPEITGTIKMSFNVDGLPLFKSSNLQFWPILGLIKNFGIGPFAIGIFCGNSKPAPLSTYLEDFLNELLELAEPFQIKNKTYCLEVHSFVCDAPARAYLKCVKSHGGYSCCEKCWESGDYYKGKVIYKGVSATKRTDISFLNMEDEEHHLDVSPLMKLKVGMVTTFPIDYMHAVCLGVMRKLLNTWISGNLQVRFHSQLKNSISDSILFLKKFIPMEFNRKPRALDELSRWKATEFRTFLLYIGPYVLRKVDSAIYEHFLLLHCGIVILVCETNMKTFGCHLAEDFLKAFVTHCDKIYHSEFMVYNVHILSHLSSDAEYFGSLDSFSAFPFENYLGTLKRYIKSPFKPLQQVYSRLKEQEKFIKKTSQDDGPIFSMEHISVDVIENFLNNESYKQYKRVSYKNYTLCIYLYSEADAYCISKDFVFQIHNIVVTSDGTAVLVGKKFNMLESFYNYPMASELLNIYYLQNLSDICTCYLDEIVGKCIVFPDNLVETRWVSFPLFHSV